MSLSPLTYANFRAATAEEMQQSQGTIAGRLVQAPWQLTCKVMGSVNSYFKNPLSPIENAPMPQILAEKLIEKISPNPEHLFMQHVYSFNGDSIYLTDPTVIEAFLTYSHNDIAGLFGSNKSSQVLFEILKRTFPQNQFSEENFIFTSSFQNNQRFHNFLIKLLQPITISGFRSQMDETAQNCLLNWESQYQKNETINATKEVSLFVSTILAKCFFNIEETNLDLAEAISFIHSYLITQNLGLNTEDNEALLSLHLTILNTFIEHLLAKKEADLFQNSEFSHVEKKALLFGFFVKGQQTIASILTYIIWQIAKDPTKQEELHAMLKSSDYPLEQKISNMKKLFNQFMEEFNPVHEIARKIDKAVCLEYRLEGDKENRTVIYSKDQIMGVQLSSLAERTSQPSNYNPLFNFGEGPNKCPGENLAMQSIVRFLTLLFSEYKVIPEHAEDIKFAGYVYLQLADDVHIRIIKREPQVDQAESDNPEPALEIENNSFFCLQGQSPIGNLLRSIDLAKFTSSSSHSQ